MSAFRFSIDTIPIYKGANKPNVVAEPIWDTLQPEFQSASITNPVRFDPTELVVRGFMQVVRGTMTEEISDDTRGNVAPSWNVVAKIAFGPRRIDVLRAEARVYQTSLSKLQGKYVPLVYGFYVGESYDGPAGVLLMKDCGIRMATALKGHPLNIRLKVVEAMFHIHQAGIQHSDFSERNIVIGTGEDGEHIPMIIDFGKAQSHQCSVQWDQIQLDRLTPTQAEFQCSEMRDVCEETDVWATTINCGDAPRT
ncbi:hypothetical protein C8Q76DRAFT_175117 [Earliella scabrosa]|nr:hypothetical protein C8Q76DRAFT_175117 [Earliella scabrosa]